MTKTDEKNQAVLKDQLKKTHDLLYEARKKYGHLDYFDSLFESTENFLEELKDYESDSDCESEPQVVWHGSDCVKILIPKEDFPYGFCTTDEPDLDSEKVVFQTNGKIYVKPYYSCDGPSHDLFLEWGGDEKYEDREGVWFSCEPDGHGDYRYYIWSSTGDFTLVDFSKAIYDIYDLEGNDIARADGNTMVYGFSLKREGENWTMMDMSNS